MSQILFPAKTEGGIDVEVQAGWDHPLERYFMTVYDLTHQETDDEIVLWSAISEPDPADALATERLEKKLEELHIEVPKGFWSLVQRRERNVIYRYVREKWVRHTLPPPAPSAPFPMR